MKGISTKQKKEICLGKYDSDYGTETSNGYKDKLGECDSYHIAEMIASNGSNKEHDSNNRVETKKGLSECDSYHRAGMIARLGKDLGECDSSKGAEITVSSKEEEYLEVQEAICLERPIQPPGRNYIKCAPLSSKV